jgi:uncharacterized protein (DUF2236 family)
MCSFAGERVGREPRPDTRKGIDSRGSFRISREEPARGTPFVDRNSVVRRIWGNPDMILMIFAGAAAEFALNRAVDWLFFTGALPRDPFGRLFATAAYSQQIVFADEETALRTLQRIRTIHESVEHARGERIPDWAHRDVLYMLIHYSERAHELIEGPLTAEDQDELYDVFHRVGTGLGIPELPRTYMEWKVDRDLHLRRDLTRSTGTHDLYTQFRKQLGAWRYQLLLQVQGMLAPAHVRKMLRLPDAVLLRQSIRLYPVLIRAGLRPMIQRLLVPAQHLAAVRRLEQRADANSPDTSSGVEGNPCGHASSFDANARCPSRA